ncbi:hypothetical protein ACIGO9_14755 [Nocardia asteroides]|uniref:hypothetical protein n=1 Tax=Nocardia asteroides TaxID=1824 RepID=UPI0037C7203F
MATFTVGAAVLYAVLAGGFALWSIPMSAQAPTVDIQLVISYNDGIDTLALIAAVVIALNVAAWLPRALNAVVHLLTPDLPADEQDNRAAIYARHIALSQAALICGLGAILVGLASFADAVVLKGKLLTGIAILLAAIVIAVLSLDAESGLRDGKELEAAVRRHRNDAELVRLRKLVGRGADGSEIDPSARWSEAKTAARHNASQASRRLWWTYEAIGIISATLIAPYVALTVASRDSGISWTEIIESMILVALAISVLGAVLIALIVAATAALICQRRVIAGAIAAIAVVCIGWITASFMASLFDHSKPFADRVLTTTSALLLVWTPIVITLGALAVDRDRTGILPGGVIRRLVRRALLSRIAELESLSEAASTARSSAPPPTGWRRWLPWHAFASWYRSAAGVEPDPPHGVSPAGTPSP